MLLQLLLLLPLLLHLRLLLQLQLLKLVLPPLLQQRLQSTVQPRQGHKQHAA